MFLLFMMFAVQIAYHLYATSMVTAAAYDAARIAAGADFAGDDDGAEVAARAKVIGLLGSYGRQRVEKVDVTRDADHVAVHVVARNPSFLPFALRRSTGVDVVDRTVRVRIERVVSP